ncbi:transcription factor TFIIIB component B'' homolog [Drosophila grimshawi]|uniref:GH13453 n=1 Tax=Drosophila grimshawi TaxID=7222 RepID=B4JP75_DROGR|nr:transcription factor TFIIIB component B'' homolog [Drosophila grimshawi]EDV98705.1 GH13453 [Drosophila grimshawi]
MSSRRQRIKATANLSQIKRKPRKEDADAEPKPEPEPEPEPLPIPFAKQESVEEDASEVAFKMPAASNVNQLDDVFHHSDLEDNVIQMDLQKTASGFPMSPSKAQARQRVRPTPVFGQRRNSFVGSPMAPDYDGDYQSPGTPTRRERYLSGSSMSGASGTPQQSLASPKYFPGGGVMSPGMGRIRTESSCSVYSDSGKQRGKGEGDKSQSLAQQRINVKRDFETRFNKGIPDKSTFKMFDMIFYNPDSNPMEQKPLVTTIKAEATASAAANNSDESKPSSSELLEAKAEPSAGGGGTAAMPVPQLKLDANGEMIIDEKTLEIETTAEVEARKVLANSSLILMDETTGDNGFYRRHKRTPTWSADDTVRFYRSLQIIGTDFSLMCQMFPKRTRRDLKLKYKREERINGQLINKALLYPKAFNIQELKDKLEQEDRERAEADRKWQEIVAAQAETTKKRPKSHQSKAARNLSDGDLVYENEHVTKQKLGKHALAKRRAELVEQNGEAVGVKRKRRPLNQQPKDYEQVQPQASLQQVRAGVKQKVQQQQHEELQQPVPVQILPAFPAIIKRENCISETTEQMSSQSLCMAKGEQLQEELNSLLSESPREITEKKPLRDKVVINMDDGSLNYVSDVETPTDTDTEATYIVDFIAEEPPLEDSPNSLDSVSEHDIEQILAELSEGSMVLVSSLNADQEDRVVNEIYIHDKETGELSEHPLKIPEHIVQCILNVMS